MSFLYVYYNNIFFVLCYWVTVIYTYVIVFYPLFSCLLIVTTLIEWTILWENVHLKKRIDKGNSRNIFLIMNSSFFSPCTHYKERQCNTKVEDYFFRNSVFCVACALIFRRINYKNQFYNISFHFLYYVRTLGTPESPFLPWRVST